MFFSSIQQFFVFKIFNVFEVFNLLNFQFFQKLVRVDFPGKFFVGKTARTLIRFFGMKAAEQHVVVWHDKILNWMQFQRFRGGRMKEAEQQMLNSRITLLLSLCLRKGGLAQPDAEGESDMEE